MNLVELSLVHVCDSCRGAYVLAKGHCLSCGSTGAHYPASAEPPEWIGKMPDSIPLVGGGRVQHRLDGTVGYVRGLQPNGDILVLWDGLSPGLCAMRPDWLRVDLEDPSAGAYGYALRWAWNMVTAGQLPREICAAALGDLIQSWTAGHAPTDEDRLILAGYCDRVDLWMDR